MYLQHHSTIVQPDGVIEIEVAIIEPVKKKFGVYKYYLGSEFAARKFHSLYKVGRSAHGRALAVLNKFKIEIIEKEE